MSSNNLKLLIENTKAVYEEVVPEGAPIRKIDFGNVGSVIDNVGNLAKLLKLVVSTVEIGADSILELREVTSEEKLEAAVEMVDQNVKLPWYMSYFRKLIYRIVISLVVHLLNEQDFSSAKGTAKGILDNVVDSIKKGV